MLFRSGIPPVARVNEALGANFIKKLHGENVRVVSHRSARFDIPETENGINRVKVTAMEDGTFMTRFYKVEEKEMIHDLPMDRVEGSIEAMLAMGSCS